MKKRFLISMFTLTAILNSCMVVGGVFRAGFKMGIYFVFLVLGLIVWIILKRSNRR